MKTDAIIQARNIHQEFTVGDETVKVLTDVSFNIHQHTFNIVYGASGSGKSTLLNILSGLQQPTKGTVAFNTQEVYSFTPNRLAHFRANEIGIVYQQNFWVHSLNAIENVSMPLYFLGHTRASARKIALEALDKVGMASYAKKFPPLLSGGEQQRVAMARAIVNDPLFVIADEPTGSLDTKNGDMIMDLLQRYQTEFHRTIILVTHNMEYLPLADHLLHIQDGFVTELQHESIEVIADELMTEMKQRIERLGKTKRAQKVKP